MRSRRPRLKYADQHLMTPDSGRDDEYIPLFGYGRNHGSFAALISNFLSTEPVGNKFLLLLPTLFTATCYSNLKQGVNSGLVEQHQRRINKRSKMGAFPLTYSKGEVLGISCLGAGFGWDTRV